MNILLIAPAIPDYCIEYANALSKRAKVTLVAPARWFADAANSVDPAVELKALDWPRHRSPQNVVFLIRLMRLINRVRPDIVHFLSEGVTWLSLLAQPISRKYGLLTTMHDVQYHPGDSQSSRVPRWFANQLFRHSDKVIVHGARLRNDAAKLYPDLADRLDILPHVMVKKYSNIAARNALQRTQETAVNILFFGRIFAYKGLGVLIRCIPAVLEQFRPIKVVIAGQGEDIDSYRRMVSEPEIFEFKNYHIQDAEVAQLFVDADIVVLPYIEASQSGVLAISNSFGRAIIVTNVGELGHSVADGITGLIVPPGDEQALAAALLRLATDKTLRQQLGNAALEAAEKSASPELVADMAMGIYEKVETARKALAG